MEKDGVRCTQRHSHGEVFKLQELGTGSDPTRRWLFEVPSWVFLTQGFEWAWCSSYQAAEDVQELPNQKKSSRLRGCGRGAMVSLQWHHNSWLICVLPFCNLTLWYCYSLYRWKALDFASLEHSSVSFFKVEKPETAASRWARARTRAAKVMKWEHPIHPCIELEPLLLVLLIQSCFQVGKGLSKDEKAQKLALQHWLEAVRNESTCSNNILLR